MGIDGDRMGYQCFTSANQTCPSGMVTNNVYIIHLCNLGVSDTGLYLPEKHCSKVKNMVMKEASDSVVFCEQKPTDLLTRSFLGFLVSFCDKLFIMIFTVPPED